MSVLGSISGFQKDKENWNMYVERMEQFFIVNSVGKDKKVAVLLSSMGPETYRVLSDLLFPVNPKEKNFKELADCLQSHFHRPF